MNWFVISIIVLALIIVLLYLYATRMSVAHNFMTIYMAWMDENGDKKYALKRGIDNFTYRHPFNLLTDENINDLIEIVTRTSDHPQEIIAPLLQLSDRKKSILPILEIVSQGQSKMN